MEHVISVRGQLYWIKRDRKDRPRMLPYPPTTLDGIKLLFLGLRGFPTVKEFIQEHHPGELEGSISFWCNKFDVEIDAESVAKDWEEQLAEFKRDDVDGS